MQNSKLSDVAAISLGYQFRGPVAKDADGDFAVIQIKDIDVPIADDRLNGNPVLRPDVLERVSVKRSESAQVKTGDVLLLARGQRPVAFLVGELPGNTIATSYFFILRPDRSKVLPAFLVWSFNFGPLRSQIESIKQGTHMATITLKDLAMLTLPVPPHKVQEHIAQLTALADHERALTNAVIQKRGMLVRELCRLLAKGDLKGKEN